MGLGMRRHFRRRTSQSGHPRPAAPQLPDLSAPVLVGAAGERVRERQGAAVLYPVHDDRAHRRAGSFADLRGPSLV